MLLRRFFSSNAAALKRTPLYNLHTANGGQMVDFCGWSLPVVYEKDLSIAASVEHTRSSNGASLFDVAHMCQVLIEGKARHHLAARIFTADTRALKANTASYTLICNERGGIIDDAIVSNRDDDYLYVVVNAACAEKDVAHMKSLMRSSEDAQLTVLSPSVSLVALQGRGAVRVLERMLAPKSPPLPSLFMTGSRISLQLPGSNDALPVLITRCGYTGEDGFELSVAAEHCERLASALLAHSEVRLAGLGARDTLRLEAGLCLYGTDIDDTTSPAEAALAWAIPTTRRHTEPTADGIEPFLGAKHIVPQLNAKAGDSLGPKKRRVGLLVDGAPARHGAELLASAAADAAAPVVGHVTSGTFSPCLKKPVAMAYVNKPYDKMGTKLGVRVRNKTYEATVAKMPFVANTYVHETPKNKKE